MDREQQMRNEIQRLQTALREIIDLHGTEEHPRHECTKMANIARDVLDV